MRRSTAKRDETVTIDQVAFAKAMEMFTKPYKNGNTVGMKMNCSCEYPEIEREPKHHNKMLCAKNSGRVIADIYLEHIGSGFFWEVADDILAGYFDDSILTMRQQRGWFGMLPIFLSMWINSHCWFRSIHALLSLVVVREEK